MNTLDYLLKKYGMYLTVEDLSVELKIRPTTLICNRSAGRFTLPMHRMGRKIVADVRDVAIFIDDKRNASK